MAAGRAYAELRDEGLLELRVPVQADGTRTGDVRDTIDCDGKVIRNQEPLTEPYLPAGVTTTGMLVASTLMCPASGHHAGIGAWWVVQLGCGLGLAAASALGLQRAAPR